MSVALALDYSSSTIPATLDIEAAAKSFIDLLDTVNNDEAAIIKFDWDIFLTQVFTTSKDDLKAAIDEPFPDVRYGTSIFDAAWQAIDLTAGPSPHAETSSSSNRNPGAETLGWSSQFLPAA